MTVAIDNKTGLLCFGDADGALNVEASGGTSPYEYSKNGTDFQSETGFADLAAGDYTFISKDSNGCTVSIDTTLTTPDVLAMSIAENADELTATVTGGVTPYEYSKDGTTFQTSATFSGLAAGDYTLTVKDANACVLDVSHTLIILALDENLYAAYNIYPNPTTDYLMIEGEQVSEVVLLSLDGQIVMRKETPKGQIDMSNIPSGIYLLRIVSQNGKINNYKLAKK